MQTWSDTKITPTDCDRCNVGCRLTQHWATWANLNIYGDESVAVMEIYHTPNPPGLSLAQIGEVITSVRQKWNQNQVLQRKDHEDLALAYRKILQMHLDNLKLAHHRPSDSGFCLPAAVEKEIFRIFYDGMEWIKGIRTTAEQNIKWTAGYHMMISEANYAVYSCLRDYPDPNGQQGARESHMNFHYNEAYNACRKTKDLMDRWDLSPIDTAYMSAAYQEAMLLRRAPNPTRLWFKPLEDVLGKIDAVLEINGEILKLYSEGVQWWDARLRSAVEEGLREQETLDLALSNSQSIS